MTPRLLVLVVALLAGGVAARADGEGLTPLERTMYDFGIVEYCGLVDQAVWDGYRAEAEAIVAAEGLGEEAVKRSSFNAALAVDVESSDRGLGGYRTWCRIDGTAAAERFRQRALLP